MSDTRPAGEVLGGIELDALDAAEIPLEAIVLVKVLSDEGARWVMRSTTGLTSEEVIGALVTAGDVERAEHAARWAEE